MRGVYWRSASGSYSRLMRRILFQDLRRVRKESQNFAQFMIRLQPVADQQKGDPPTNNLATPIRWREPCRNA